MAKSRGDQGESAVSKLGWGLGFILLALVLTWFGVEDYRVDGDLDGRRSNEDQQGPATTQDTKAPSPSAGKPTRRPTRRATPQTASVEDLTSEHQLDTDRHQYTSSEPIRHLETSGHRHP